MLTKIASIIASIIIFLSGSGTKIDNTHNKNELISKQYTISQMNELKERIRSWDISFFEFAMEFQIQCIRSTSWGYYVILGLENENEAYVFMNKHFEFVDLIIVDEFMPREQFEAFVYDTQYREEIVQAYDDIDIGLSGPVDLFSFHVVKEGVCIVQYEMGFDVGSRIAGSAPNIRFISDEEITILNKTPNFDEGFPFVWAIDK